MKDNSDINNVGRPRIEREYTISDSEGPNLQTSQQLDKPISNEPW